MRCLALALAPVEIKLLYSLVVKVVFGTTKNSAPRNQVKDHDLKRSVVGRVPYPPEQDRDHCVTTLTRMMVVQVIFFHLSSILIIRNLTRPLQQPKCS
jgi:hypothetical protein